MLNPIEAVKAKEELTDFYARLDETQRSLARQFPYGKLICYIHDVARYVIGYTPDDLLIVSPVVPWKYEQKRDAMKRSVYLSGEAARMGVVKPVERNLE